MDSRVLANYRRHLSRKQGGLCKYCGKKVTPVDDIVAIHGGEFVAPPDMETLDHVIPLALGGSNRYDNFVMCCYDCNQRKGSQALEEHLPWNWLQQPKAKRTLVYQSQDRSDSFGPLAEPLRPLLAKLTASRPD